MSCYGFIIQELTRTLSEPKSAWLPQCNHKTHLGNRSGSEGPALASAGVALLSACTTLGPPFDMGLSYGRISGP